MSLAAVTSGDNTNILTARIARETYEIPNVVARIYDPRRAQIYLRLGHPDRGHRVVDHRPGAPAAGPGARSSPSGPTRPAPSRWSSGRCPSGGPESGWPICRVPGDVTVVAVTRAGVAHLDFGDLVGQDGDVLHLMVPTPPSTGSTPAWWATTVPPVRPPEAE